MRGWKILEVYYYHSHDDDEGDDCHINILAVLLKIGYKPYFVSLVLMTPCIDVMMLVGGESIDW